MKNYIFIQNDPLLPYRSAARSKEYLYDCYLKANISNAEETAFNNCYRFMNFLEHGTLYLQQTIQAPLAIQPTLAFYALTHLIKACLLTVDPDYPATVQVLSHGLSTRKKKKQNYLFFDDEVKVQRNGLFPHFCEKMFHMKHLEETKLNMKTLFLQIPELSSIFTLHHNISPFYNCQKKGKSILLPKKIIDNYKMTDSRFINYIKERTQSKLAAADNGNNYFALNVSSSLGIPPLRYSITEGNWLFSRRKDNEAFYPELALDYALLYNLSMVARYETEWWYEVLKLAPGDEFPFITLFINSSMQKLPFLIDEFLSSNVTRDTQM